MTDRQIINLLIQRNEDGIVEAQRLYGPRLARIAASFLPREDAEECLNDMYLAVWKHIPPDDPNDLLSYMATILRNLSKNRLRAAAADKRRGSTVSLTDELYDCIPDPNANTEEEALLLVADSLNHFLEKQPVYKRQMFVLRYWYGKSIPEISEHFGFSNANTEKMLNRMRIKLKIAMREGL